MKCIEMKKVLVTSDVHVILFIPTHFFIILSIILESSRRLKLVDSVPGTGSVYGKDFFLIQ